MTVEAMDPILAESQIIFVGAARAADTIEARLRYAGFDVLEVESARELAAALRGVESAVVVALAPEHDYEEAHRVVETAGLSRRKSPVVVLFERCDFGEYYRLMNEGALEFYELSEPAERIAQGVSWAAYARCG